MAEQWKPVPGYEGIYEASSLGRIRTAPGKTTSNARYPVRVWKSRIIKPKHPVSRKRHDLRVSLWKDGKCKDFLVSRLVASAWICPPEDGMTVNHINGDYTDNRPENLEWVSLSENIQHGFKTGLYGSFCEGILLVSNNGSSAAFRSKAKASAYLGRSPGYISSVLSKGRMQASDENGKKYIIVLL